MPGFARGAWARARSIHPAFVLAFLDIVGLLIASYLATTELSGGTPTCGPTYNAADP